MTLSRELASFEPRGLPVLSIYLDLRPGGTGARPATRPADIILKDRLHEIESTLLPRGAALDSVRADIERINTYLGDEVPSESAGVAIFACHGAGLFRAITVGAAFENQVTAHEHPDLFQLVRLVDDFETAVVAVADSNTLRVFAVASGATRELSGLDEDSASFQKRATGGWSQARYQRHVSKHQADFAAESAHQIESIIKKLGAVRLVVAGDEVVMPLLLDALTPASLSMLAGDPLRIDIRAPRDDIAEEVAGVLRAAEMEDDAELLDSLFASVQRGGMGVIGDSATRAALERGQVHILFLDSTTGTEDARADLSRAAIATSAQVEVVEDDERLREVGGIAAILRWPLDLGTATEALTA